MNFFENFKKRFQRPNIQKETDEKQFSKLSSLFVKDPHKAIKKSQNYFLKSKKITYEEFIDDVKSTQKSNCCIFAWNKRSLCGQCFDCEQKENTTCFCIQCFLSGHHDKHNSILYYTDSGSCDCGNPTLIKPSGFCPNHPGPDPNPDITQMTPENRQKFITVFKAAFYGAMKSTSTNNYNICIKYISQFITYGDGIRRCVSYAIVSLFKEHLLPKLLKMDKSMVQDLIDLFGQLVSDLYFLEKISLWFYKNYGQISNKMTNLLYTKNHNEMYESLILFLSFSYHFFCDYPVVSAIKKENFDWPTFLVNFISNSLNTLKLTRYEYNHNYEAGTLTLVLKVSQFLSTVLQLDDQHDKIQEFIDRYSNLLVDFEGMISFHVHTTPQDESDGGYNLANMSNIFSGMSLLFTNNNRYLSEKNKVFSVSRVVSNLLLYSEKNNLEVKSIVNSKDKTKISSFYPLHFLFFCLLQNYKDTKTLIEDECKKNKVSLQYFCSTVSILPIRIIAFTYLSGKFTKLNRSFLTNLKYIYLYPEYSFNGYFGLVQTLLGIAPQPEKIMKNILTTFGCFDNLNLFSDLDDNELDRQLFLIENTHFDASLFILSLLTDRSIISLENIHFKRLRAIELLEKGRATAKEIEEYTNEHFRNQNFSDDLFEYIERFTNKKGQSFFRIKNEGDFTPYFPPITVNDRIKLLMKYNDKLIPVLDYSELPRQISLLSCFRLPVIIALTFKLLSSSDTDITTKQVGFSLFISLVRNGETISPESFDEENPISIVANDLNGLVSELETVSNQLDKVNILTISIQYENKEPSSLLKLVQSSQPLGKLVVDRTDLPSSLSPQSDKVSKLIREKKAKAALFKQRLMKEYQSKQKMFGATEQSPNAAGEKPSETQQKVQEQSSNNDLDDEDDLDSCFNKNEMICNVCLSNQDDIFGFPCLSLPTTLPALIDGKLHKKNFDYKSNEGCYSMNICSHNMHYKCFVRLLKDALDKEQEGNHQTEIFHCPIDRGSRNCFLPLFEKNSEDDDQFNLKPSIILKVAIKDFIKRAFYNKANSDISIPIKSFSGIVMKLEVRHRNRPESLDAPNVPILLRNLLLTLYHGLHELAVKKADIVDKMTNPLDKLLFEIIKSEDPINDFTSHVKNLSSGLNGDYLYEFLRRAAIVEDFAINNVAEKEKFIDWDDVLSVENLLERFDLNSTQIDHDIQLPLFETIDLPEKFINLYLQPYNMDIFDTSVIKVVDLLTGTICRIENMGSAYDKKYQSINEYMENVYNNGLAMFMYLTGGYSTSMLFYSPILGKELIKGGFYTDQFGDVDPGFTRGIITSLSKDRLENALDSFLSGDMVLF